MRKNLCHRPVSIFTLASALVLGGAFSAAAAQPTQPPQPTPVDPGLTYSALVGSSAASSTSLPDNTAKSQASGDSPSGATDLSIVKSASGVSAIVDKSLASSGLVTAIAPSFVQLSWVPSTSETAFAVLRDGMEIAELPFGTSTYQDSSVVPGHTYSYVIDPVNPPTSGLNARSWGVTASVPKVSTQMSPSKSSAALQSNLQSQVVAAAAASTTTLTWESFIPQSRIDAPSINCSYGSGYQFGGDGHGFDWTASSHRTSESAVITWSSKAVAGYTSVGTSHVYKKSTGALVAQKTASASNMSVYKLGGSGNSVDIRMVNHASNPFCTFGAIDGAMSITVTQSGNWSIFSGNYRQMPDNYIYFYNGGRVTNVLEATYGSEYCLAGAALCDLVPLSGFTGKFS